MPRRRTICWSTTVADACSPAGLEHLLLAQRSADSVVLAFDDAKRPFRLSYRLEWDDSWRARRAELAVTMAGGARSVTLCADGVGRWLDGDGQPMPALDGCIDIDIWPTPFTNTFPIRRVPLGIGERREFLMAWIEAPGLTMHAQAQAYTRLAERRYLFENLDGSGFRAELEVDDNGIVIDYPELFRRVPSAH